MSRGRKAAVGETGGMEMTEAAPRRMTGPNEHYCPSCGQVISNLARSCPHCGAPAAFVSDKSRLAALLLCFFLGCFGVHRFYVGKIGTGLLQLFTIGGFGIWALVDFILIAVGEFRDKAGDRVLEWMPAG
jgi:predicted RNA-binding Zn-ribbon protein involved in translation (DUF1610 family)